MKEIDLETLGCTSMTLNAKSFDTSTLTLKWARKDARALSGSGIYMTPIRALWQGRTIIEGVITSLPKSIGAESAEQTLIISDRYWFLQHCCLFGSDQDPRWWVRSINHAGEEVNDPAVPARDALAQVLRAARKTHGANYELRISATSKVMSMQGSCKYAADYLREIRRWTPNLVSWYEYNGGIPTLIISDIATLPIMKIPRLQYLSDSVELTARPDLICPAVGIVNKGWEKNADGNYNIRKDICVYPPGADLSVPNALVMEISTEGQVSNSSGNETEEVTGSTNAGGYQLERQYMEAQGRKLQIDKLDWWKQVIPELNSVTNPVLGTGISKQVMPQTITCLNYANEELDYELIDGTLSTLDKSVHWCDMTICATIRIDGDEPKELRGLFPKFWGTSASGVNQWVGEFRVVVRCMDRSKHRYLIKSSYEELDDDVDETEEDNTTDTSSAGLNLARDRYNALVKEYWLSTQTLLHEGTCRLHGVRGDALLGRRIQLLGGTAEWEHMTGAVVQGVTWDIDKNGGQVTLSLGGAGHLSLDELLERSKIRADVRRNITEKTKTDATSTRWNNGQSWEFPENKKVKAPTIGPKCERLQTGREAPVDFDFEVKLQGNINGEPSNKTLVRQGRVMYKGKIIGTIGKTTWTTLDTGTIWANITLNGDVAITAQYSNTPIESSPPNTYAIPIATTTASNIMQHQWGTIILPSGEGSIPYPWQVTLRQTENGTWMSGVQVNHGMVIDVWGKNISKLQGFIGEKAVTAGNVVALKVSYGMYPESPSGVEMCVLDQATGAVEKSVTEFNATGVSVVELARVEAAEAGALRLIQMQYGHIRLAATPTSTNGKDWTMAQVPLGGATQI